MTESLLGVPLIQVVGTEIIPLDRLKPTEDKLALLHRVLLMHFEQKSFDPEPGGQLATELSIYPEAVFGLPGLEGFSVVFGGTEEKLISIVFRVAPESLQLRLGGDLCIRFPRNWLRPVTKRDNKWIDNPLCQYTEISLSAEVVIDQDGNVTFDGPNEFSLGPAMIADTGFVIEGSVAIDLSEGRSIPETQVMGFDDTWRGVVFKTLKLNLPNDLDVPLLPNDLILTNFHIGSGGISGAVRGQWTPKVVDAQIGGAGAGTLFGVPFGLKKLDLELLQNAITSMEIKAYLALPYFNQVVDVELNFDLNGNIAITVDSETGYKEFTLKSSSIELMYVVVTSLTIKQQEGVLSIAIGGSITPLFRGLDWPTFDVKELTIDSEGNVHLEGGWLDVRNQYSLNFYGFQIEITKLGFGSTDDGGKWIGFSGSLNLVEGLAAGGSVEGLRIVWYDDKRKPKITLNGIGVELEIPDVLRFKGQVSYRELPDGVPRFDGAIKLGLIALDMELDGQLVIGTNKDGDPFLAIYLATELPAGIPLWSTGLALYGMAGLFALQMEPNKQEDQAWYGSGNGDWYHSGSVGVTELDKWKYQPDSLALGAGVTIGTLTDNGFIFSGRMVLVILFPGPVLLIEGQANLLEERSALGGLEEPRFRALAVLDGRAGTFLIGLDAQYKYGSSGQLIDIHGSAEAYFSLSDASAWHLYLGEKEPREKRIRAEVLSLFEANSYLMLDARWLAMGAWVGYDKRWKYGPLKVTLEAWLEGGAILSWNPAHFYGLLWLHGKAGLSVFGFGVGLTVDAQIAADVFYPFHVLGKFRVRINLPWPLPDFGVGITLEWGPEPTPPQLPLPLKEVAIAHLKVSTHWPLPRDQFLLPGDTEPANFDALSVVPLDSRPQLTFTRPINDDALVGVNVHPGNEVWERIGDPMKKEGPVQVRYGLEEIVLEKRIDNTQKWQRVAWSPNNNQDSNQDKTKLFGSWEDVPAMPDGDGKAVGQVKLLLWSKTPFDYTRHTGRAWDEWFCDRFRDYPCIPPAPQREVCYTFDWLDPEETFPSPWFHPEGPWLRHPHEPSLALSWIAPDPLSVNILDKPVNGLTHALCFPNYIGPNSLIHNYIAIHLPRPNKGVKLIHEAKEGLVYALDEQGNYYGPFHFRYPDTPFIEILGENLVVIAIRCEIETCLLGVCMLFGPDPEEVDRRAKMSQHLVDEMVHWYQQGEVLEPHTIYRLKVVTTINAKGEGELSGYSPPELQQTEYAYFRTEGPPGLATLSRPLVHPTEEFNSGLDDLTPYVKQTLPITVPATGEKPFLPRPVYRGYDVKVAFKENYVDLMYRLERRDLGLYLYDTNNRPVHDVQGRLIALGQQWGVQEELTLTESEKRWVAIVNGSNCDLSLSFNNITHNKKLTSAAEGQVLNPDTVYEARLIPLLLHEDFASYAVGTCADGPDEILDRLWIVRDEGTQDGPSHWEIREAGTPPTPYIIQTSNIWDNPVGSTDPVKPGTMLLAGEPGWTDYRLSAYLRSSDDGAIGVVFRYRDPNHYYRFSMDRERQYRRLVRVVDGHHTILAADDFVYRQNQDYLIAIEAIGSSLRVYQDGALVFDVTDQADAAISAGQIGLYCWRNGGARFTDIRVEDFRQNAPILYRFQFTTSRFANFFHQMHSFQDETWRVQLAPTADVTELLAQAVPPATPPSDIEARAYVTLAAKVLGQSANQNPPEVQVTWVEQEGEILALLLQSPEPIDWKRTELQVMESKRPIAPPTIPGNVKLTDASFGTSQPNEESVTLLLREATNLTGYRLEYRYIPGPLAEPADDPVLFVDEFQQFESLGVEAPDSRWTIVDEGTVNAPSRWRFSHGELLQTSAIQGGDAPAYPGTYALAGDPQWSDLRLSVRMHSDAGNAIGVTFRYVDGDNYYRLSLDANRNYRRLIKKQDGVVTTLWEEVGGYKVGESFTLSVDAIGSRLVGYLDNIRLFDLTDNANTTGRIGMYCWNASKAHFEWVEVRRLPLESYVLLRDCFIDGDISGWRFIDEGTIDSPSNWAIFEGTLRQTGNIYSDPSGRDALPKKGTQAITGDPSWKDVIVSVRLASLDDGAIGLLFRYTDESNYYRFSMDKKNFCRRLVKNVGGTITLLWEDGLVYKVGRTYEVTMVVIGSTLRGYLDGVLMFVVEDEALAMGCIGLYCWRNNDARFSHVQVYSAEWTFNNWLFNEPFDVLIPGLWTFLDDLGRPITTNWQVSNGELRISVPSELVGIYALTGSSSWTNYRLGAEIRTECEDEVGLVFRYVDKNNYYSFGIFNQRAKGLWYPRLTKRVNGTFHILLKGDPMTSIGQKFILTMDCFGSQLTGYYNGVPLVTVNDSDLTAGQIGIYCREATQARFGEVQVSAPAWIPYYAFGREVPLPAGTQVQVYGGNSANPAPIPSRPGVTDRFIASLGEYGRLRLPPEGTSLRIRSSSSLSNHTRQFLPDSAYNSSADVSILRSDDGTGMFLVISHYTRSLHDQFRLKFLYNRDNRIVDPQSHVLSQAGCCNPESVMIDLIRQ
jgi:hypothetical protein